ncbi:MAG: protein kinase, partial [Acidobacteriota bacterium]
HPFIAMQLIEGPVLSDVAAQLTLEQGVLVIKQVAEAVHAAHRAGLIHRDLKPANIMLEPGEDAGWRPFVVDFGLVREVDAERLTVTGATMGTPSYMAPEQALGEASQLDRRADVYSLGATLYALLAGRPPHIGASPVEVMLKVLHEEAPPLRQVAPRVPLDLENVVMKCLEKEPQRRYDSARALAEDLGRFLDGEPVEAQPASWSYLLIKRARKNLALVGVGGLALLATLVLTGMWWHARRTATGRAALAQRFGAQVERVEGLLWREKSLELHDLGPAKKRVRQRLREIEEEMAQQGEIAVGPGNYALGRGFLALGEAAQARERLARAWESGFRSPEAAYALGVALGQLYQKELGALARIRNEEEREARRNVIEAELKTPALSYLRSSTGADLEAPEYAQALLAFHEVRYEEALKLARTAFASTPFLWEAKILEAEILTAIGKAHRAQGEYERAQEAYHEADGAYRRAARIGESDPRAYDGRCLLWRNVLIQEVWSLGRGSQETMDTLAKACNEALVADPASAAAFNALAEGLLTWGEHETANGLNPYPSLEKAIAAAGQATSLQPGDDAFVRTLGLAYLLRGKSEESLGQDPRESLRQAAVHSRRAIQLNPRSFYAWSDLGLVFLNLGLSENRLGHDPRESLKEAIRSCEEANRIFPTSAENLTNLGSAHWVWMLHQLYDAGEDPRAAASKGEAAFRQALVVNPRYRLALVTLGSVLVEVARFEIRADLGGGERLEEVLAALDAAREVSPNDADGRGLRAMVWLVRAELEFSRNRLMNDALAKARAALADGLAINPKNFYCLTREVEVELLQARSNVRRSQSPLAALERAGRAAEKALASGTRDATASILLGEVCAERGEWNAGAGAEKDAQRGLQAVDGVLAVAPEMGRALALKARLQLLRAESERDARLASVAVAEAERLLALPSVKRILREADLQTLGARIDALRNSRHKI